MERTTIKPWHQVVQLREDVRTGELSLSDFAADLYNVVMDEGPLVYRDTSEFFSLTYPTLNLRQLARDVTLRLAGKNDKAVRQLELIYGGGKTHTLITLYHLTHDPRNLPESSSADDFIRHIGQLPPKARIAVLPFDKLDTDKGMEVRGPDGTVRRLYEPWSVLAYQLAGSDGLKSLHGQGLDEERRSAPAEPLLVELLSMPGREGLAPLVLIDEVLMYVREKVRKEPLSRGSILNFFQYLTQAATKVKNCAIVASLLATNPEMNDTLGKELTNQLSAIFRRELEQTVEPVVKEDVAEVLRRRFFDPKSWGGDRKTVRNSVISIVKNIAALDERTENARHQAEERFQNSYPFHPDLTEVLYAKWTQLEGFQRTRGILRIFARALRDAEKWDRSPIISANVFLNLPDKSTLAEAARELTNVAETEDYEGKRQQWTSILEGELERARDIQLEFPILRAREIEQAVFATFLHSQPIGKKAQTGELLSLIGVSGPQRIDIEKALRRWMEISWFLDESAFYDDKGVFITKGLPGFWRLGALPNLRQMHHEASEHVPVSVVEANLLTEIEHCKDLTRGAQAVGARVHLLPGGVKEVDDDGDFHYVVLGPEAVSRPGSPSAQAKRYVLEKASVGAPRIYRNAVVVVAPSNEGLEGLRNAIRRHQGWIDVRNQLKGQNLDNSRVQLMEIEEKNEARRITALVRQAYNIVVTLSEKEDKQDDVIAFRLDASDEPLFEVIKQDERSRIRETPVTAEALLPEGPFFLWHEGDTEYRVNDLVLTFAQYARLPKMLNSRAIVQTLLDGCRQGHFVLRSDRGDGTSRTYWYDNDVPTVAEAKKLNLSVVLSTAAQLTSIPFYRLAPKTADTFPKLWQSEELRMAALYRYFDGCTLTVAYEGYVEPFVIPKAARSVVNQAVKQAVQDRQLWLLYGSASFYGEDVPDDLLFEDAILQGPPPVIATREIMLDALPEAWRNGSETNVEVIREALSNRYGKVLPWLTVSAVITNALRSRFIERTVDSGYWPCSALDASRVKLSLRQEVTQRTAKIVLDKSSSASYSPAEESPATNGTEHNTPLSSLMPDTLTAEAALQDYELQDLVDHMAQIVSVCGDLGIPTPTFHVRIAFDVPTPLTKEQIERLKRALQSASERFEVR